MLSSAVEDGRLGAVLAVLAADAGEVENVRSMTRSALLEGLADGRLDTVLSEAQRDDASAEVRSLTRNALLQGLADGRLDSLLGQAAAEGDSVEVRSLTRHALLQGLADGRLDSLLAEASAQMTPTSQTKGLVPQPPVGAPPGIQSPARNRRLAAGSNVANVMLMVSDADRKVGSLQEKIAEKERQIKEADVTCDKLTENLQFVRADFDHLSVDLQWHQEQILSAEDRHGRLNEDRRALALKLDEMRLKGLKDEWPTGAKQSQTARSWTSTVTGGGAATVIDSAYSGWNTERSAISCLPAVN